MHHGQRGMHHAAAHWPSMVRGPGPAPGRTCGRVSEPDFMSSISAGQTTTVSASIIAIAASAADPPLRSISLSGCASSRMASASWRTRPSARQGSTVSAFSSSTATGCAPLTYQWRFSTNATPPSAAARTASQKPISCVVVSVKPLKDNGTASVVVENEELQGRAACLVLLTPSGEMVAEAKTVIGGG